MKLHVALQGRRYFSTNVRENILVRIDYKTFLEDEISAVTSSLSLKRTQIINSLREAFSTH